MDEVVSRECTRYDTHTSVSIVSCTTDVFAFVPVTADEGRGAARGGSELDDRCVRRVTSRAATVMRGGGGVTGGRRGPDGGDDDDDDGCETAGTGADDCEDKRASFNARLACSSITISR